ncbi:unnamed protein product [Oncorhynchus mykiss]|uniref:Uncharacterized protein n=1 Tax=Oncorhynchus mykiss TaxID=8022 RepID=A0A060X1J4_ONCMY|nr:unnamed protein product [Oncorhynchus mykiss]
MECNFQPLNFTFQVINNGPSRLPGSIVDIRIPNRLAGNGADMFLIMDSQVCLRSEAADDEVMRTEMSSLVEPMTVSGQHVLLAAQKLRIQPSLAEHREELITATQNVLLGVVKILSVEDDATVRKTIAAADWVLDCLSSLASSLDILSLLKAFHRFTEALVLLNNLVVERAEALQDPRQTEHLHNSLDSLRKCISMLHTAMVTTIKHRTSEQAQAAKTYILDRVKSTVKDIVTTLESYCHRGGVALGPCGYYIDRRDALIRLLASSSSSSSISNVDSLLRDLVFHCMVVANSSQRELQLCVVDHCRHVLHIWSEMSRLVKLPENPDDDNLNQHLQSICFSLMQQIQNLDSAMMTAVLYQVLDTFVTGSSPLEDLVNMFGQVLENDSVEELPVDPVSIRVLLMDLLTQADRMIQVASFISAFATDSKSLENVENSRACLTRLKAEIEPLALELDKDGSDVENCFEAVQKLHDLCERWEEETGQLQDALCDIIDVRDFTSLAVHEMANDQCGCDAAYKAQNHKLFRKHADDLISHTKQVVHSVRRHVDKSDNPIYRNGLLELSKVMSLCADVVQLLTSSDITPPSDCQESFTTSKEAQETFETAAELLFKNAKAATKRVEDCFNYIRNPRARINLRSINDHLSFQISDIVSRARLVVETHCIYDTLSLEIQIQCWSAKARFLAEEIYKVDGLSQETKEHIKVGLQGGTPGDSKEGMTESNLSPTLKKLDYQPDIAPWQTTNPENINTTEQNSSICGATLKYEPATATKQYDAPRSAFFRDTLSLTYLTPSLTYTALFLKQETDRWDARGNRIVQVTREIADQIYHMAQYLRRKGPILSKEMFVNTAKGVVSNCQYITHFVRVISNHCLDKQCTAELSLRVEQILTITNQLTIISSVNALTPGSKSSDEILVKNAQNLLQIVLHGVRAAETACIKGLKQPEPNSDGVEAAALCFQWKRNLQMHRAQQNCNSDTDDLGLRRTSQHRESPSLALPIHIQKQGFK